MNGNYSLSLNKRNNMTGSARNNNHSVEDRARSRLAQLAANAGLSEGTVATEVLLLLPDTFVKVYTDLYFRALKLDGGTGGGIGQGDEGKVKAKIKSGTSRTRIAHAGGAKGTGKRYRNAWTVKDEGALKVKQGADRKLRGVARWIRGELEELREVGGDGYLKMMRCPNPGCKRFVESEWTYCAGCGIKLEVPEMLPSRG
jgi:hypothetical protein